MYPGAEVTPSRPRFDSRVIGAVVAIALVGLIVGLLSLFGSGPNPPSTFDDVLPLVAGLAFFAIIGWWAGGAAAAGGWGQAAVVGVGLGIGWWPLALSVMVIASVVDVAVQGAGTIGTLGPEVLLGLYGLLITTVMTAAIGIPNGIAWGIAAHWVATRSRRIEGVRVHRHPSMVALGALLVLAISSGAALAATDRRPGERCLDLGGQQPLGGSFSPAGDRLAIVASNDVNEGGTVYLFEWPSGERLATWSTWVGDYIAVAPDGRVYWSADQYEPPWIHAVMTAAVGSNPEWLTTNDGSALWNLVWTVDGLRGVTGETHVGARIRLDAGADPPVQRVGGTAPIGVFWASSDDRTTITAAEWFAHQVTLTTADGSTADVQVVNDPRSVALSASGTAVIAASWDGGTRRYDIATGGSTSLLRRSQSWVAVSSQGDLAWADDERSGPGLACVAPIGQ